MHAPTAMTTASYEDIFMHCFLIKEVVAGFLVGWNLTATA